MKIKLNTNLVPIFSGTYETQWDVIETNDNGDEMNVVYDHNDLMKSIANEYQNHADYILSEFEIPFIKKIKFTGGFDCPPYYNFSTDTLDFEIIVNKTQLLRALNELADGEEFATFLKEHFTSYDGFMSFTPNNYADLKIEILEEGREFTQSIGALISFLALDKLSEIEESIHEDWRGNEYRGLDYHVECWKCDGILEYPYEHECEKEKTETIPENQLSLF